MSFEEISTLDDVLCQYCMCTEYGLNMDLPNPSGVSFGCEGSYCKDAYERYLEECEEE